MFKKLIGDNELFCGEFTILVSDHMVSLSKKSKYNIEEMALLSSIPHLVHISIHIKNISKYV